MTHNASAECGLLNVGSAKANGREPKSCLGRVFNFKLDCLASQQNKCMADMQSLLELKTRPRFCPVNWILSMLNVIMLKVVVSNFYAAICLKNRQCKWPLNNVVTFIASKLMKEVTDIGVRLGGGGIQLLLQRRVRRFFQRCARVGSYVSRRDHLSDVARTSGVVS